MGKVIFLPRVHLFDNCVTVTIEEEWERGALVRESLLVKVCKQLNSYQLVAILDALGSEILCAYFSRATFFSLENGLCACYLLL